MDKTEAPSPADRGSGSNDLLGRGPERAAFEAWLNPGNHAGNVSRWVEQGRYEKETHELAWLAWRAAAAAERDSRFVVARALLIAAMLPHNQDKPAGAVRASAVELFGQTAVDAAMQAWRA